MEESMNLVHDSQDKVIKPSKIEGAYNTYIDVMATKYQKECGKELKVSIIILDSFNGVEHQKIQERNRSIVSFISAMLTEAGLKFGISSSSSHSILTWQQMCAVENAANLFLCLQSINERKKEIYENRMESLSGFLLFFMIFIIKEC